MTNALILSGAGRYADPWHPFAETSARLGELLADAGFAVQITQDIDRRLEDLSDVDLLVVNAGDPELSGRGSVSLPSASAGLDAFVGRGGSILGMHTASASLRDLPRWGEILGGRWVRGESMHPEFGRARITVYPDRHPIVAGTRDFEVEDERYSRLRVSPEVTVLASHTLDGDEHPLVWVHELGRARIVYDALGHDARSYRSDGHRRLLARAARWLIGAL